MKLLATYSINALVSLCALLLPVNGLAASGLPDAPPPSPKITAALTPFVEKQLIAGAVTLVESKERVLDFQTIGYADMARKIPMRTDTMFWIASMTKPITATALMMLVDEGKVNIDDPVSKYLPEFKGQWMVVEHDANHILLKQPKHPITIKNILTHTSGLSHISPIEKPRLDCLPLRVAVASYPMTPLLFEPDSQFQYVNEGFNTAGRIIEVVSGMPYAEFLAKRIFEPLGMKDTTFWPTQEQVNRLAKTYKPTPDKKGLVETPIHQLTYPLTNRARQPMPAGGLFSTAADISKFCRMILGKGEFNGKRLVSEAAVKQMTSKETGALARFYGFGWSDSGVPDLPATVVFGHGGAYKTCMWVDMEKQMVMVLLVQNQGYRDDEMGKLLYPAFVKTARELGSR